MNFEESLVTQMEATSALTAVVSTRIYPNIIPQEAALPALAYQTISSGEWLYHTGAAQRQEIRVEITVRASTYLSAKAVIAVLKSTFRGYKGTLGGAGGVTVYYMTLDNEIDGFDKESGHTTVRIDIRSVYI